MRQSLTRVQAYYYDEFADKIQEQIDDYYEDGFELVDIQYFGMDDEDRDCHAFLLFQEFNKDYEEKCCGKREMDTRCNKKQGRVEGNSGCQKRGENSCG